MTGGGQGAKGDEWGATKHMNISGRYRRQPL